MGMKWLHAVVAVITVMLFLVRQKCAFAGVCRIGAQKIKNNTDVFGVESYGDTALTPGSRPPVECYVCARECCTGAHSPRPKYKRDPDISIDNEYIGQHPYDE